MDELMDTTFSCSGPSTSLQATYSPNISTLTGVSSFSLTSSMYSVFLSQPPRPLYFLRSPARSMLAVTHLRFQHSSLRQSRNMYVPILALVEVSTYRFADPPVRRDELRYQKFPAWTIRHYRHPLHRLILNMHGHLVIMFLQDVGPSYEELLCFVDNT